MHNYKRMSFWFLLVNSNTQYIEKFRFNIQLEGKKTQIQPFFSTHVGLISMYILTTKLSGKSTTRSKQWHAHTAH